ncbi:hypothetical protein ACL7TT_12750 [Microbulbifer sp. 2304DJ12-6]|uniref:hypothetical protein n=1 Tax=Microbulbifer sp. 2304DJ12-6 TaxID=3233340 RepID=UPI0039B00413
MSKRNDCAVNTNRKQIADRLRASLHKRLILLGSALLLTACSGESSDEIAQEQPLDLSLQQCELAQGGIVGTAIDPIMVDGVETQACLLNTDFGQSGKVKLKTSHQYEPLAWVLDGVYDIGQSKPYATLAEMQADEVVDVSGAGSLVYAREGSMAVVHRNARLSINIESIDDNRSGGGEWGGVVVNSIGYHPDCGDNTSSENFCNIQGPWGYYGGLSRSDTRYGPAVLTGNAIDGGTIRTGFLGYVAEAGGATKNNLPLEAAVTINAPHFAQTQSPQGVLYSANTGLELNGGALRASIYAMGNQGHAIHWHSGFGGKIGNDRIIYHDSDTAALKGEASSPAMQEDPGVQIDRLTMVDKALTAAKALEVSGGGDIAVEHFVVQGFNTCLSIADPTTRVALSNSVLYCDKASRAVEGEPDYAEPLLSQGKNNYTLNPDLKSDLALDNVAIQGVTNAKLANLQTLEVLLNYDFRLLYEPCFGVGTPLAETVDIGPNTYSICELQGQVNSGLYFDEDINDAFVAWRLKGPVTFGNALAALSSEAQVAHLQQPKKVILDGDSKLLLDATSSLTFHADVALSVRGSADDPVALATRDAEAHWAGMTINGLDNQCASEAACALAAQPRVNIHYLRLLNAGNGQPALKLQHVGAGAKFNHLDIANSQTGGLALDGGAANIDWLLVSNVKGDLVSWANGYRGTLQYAILQPGDESNGHALLGRNNPADHNATPRSRPVMANITLQGAESSDTAILLEDGSGLLLYNSVVTEFATCLDIDDPATSNLQFSDPLEIYFDNVVLDCGRTVPDEDEDGGHDFATATQRLSGVHKVAAVLDSNFVATGGDIPGIDTGIDLILAGDAARYLNANVGYMGSVLDSLDDWYQGWSDSVAVLLAAECDYKGVLEKDYVYEKSGSVYKVCGLRGTIIEDFIITTFTGDDRVAIEGGYQVKEEVYPGDFLERDPLPTLWLINGLVRIGEGHLAITDTAQVAAMKADPVTLGMEASSIVMVAKGGGLHITRGGALEVIGDVSLANAQRDGDAAGPVNLIGLIPPASGLTIPLGYPWNGVAGTWTGLIIDGFARNNQCPEAMAEPGSRVCNIQGEYGYHGGYDDNHGNVNIENLHLLQGSLRLNSVGRGGKIENLYFGLGDLSGTPRTPAAWGSENVGRAAVDINGGVVNLRNIQIHRGVPGNSLRWNHGYRGSMQSVYIEDFGFLDALSSSQEEFFSTLIQKAEVWYDYPTISGRSGDPDALPRSMPTIANLALHRADSLMFFDPTAPSVTTTALELVSGSGLFLHNSIVGADKSTDIDFPGFFGATAVVDQCVSFGEGVTPLLGKGIIFDQVAFACKELSQDPNLANRIDNHFRTQAVNNQTGIVSNASTIPLPSQATSDIYYSDWVFGAVESSFDEVDGVNSFSEWHRIYSATTLINLGQAEPDYSKSESADMNFLKDSPFFGASNYFIPINAGEEIHGESE